MESFWNGPLGSDPKLVESYCEELAQLEASRLLRRLMKEGLITQAQLAVKVGKDPAEITRYLKGTRNMTLKSLAQCLAAMGCRLTLNAEKISRPLGGQVLRVHDGEQWRGNRQGKFTVESGHDEVGDNPPEAA